jgi:hypothetical protein
MMVLTDAELAVLLAESRSTRVDHGQEVRQIARL